MLLCFAFVENSCPQITLRPEPTLFQISPPQLRSALVRFPFQKPPKPQPRSCCFSSMASQVVKVRRDTVEACMTCPLCNRLLKEATTISLCLHTFCRKCIYEKLSDDEVDCCPVCNIDLGCLPVEKLRPDHNLQDLRAKIFPFKQKKIKAPEVVPSISLPIKRKERSLSSLVVSTPKVLVQTGLTGRRTKPVVRKSSILRGCNLAIELTKKEQDCSVSSTRSDSLNKVVQHRRQDSLTSEHSNMQNSDENIENDGQLMEGKADLWTPLNCLVEAANRTKSSKYNSQGFHAPKSEPLNSSDGELYPHSTKTKDEPVSARENEAYTPKTKLKVRGHKTRIQDDKNGITLLPGPAKRRRLCPVGHKQSTGSEDLGGIDDAEAKQSRRTSPIWFSLVASEDQKGDVSLPQISACYLRIKDGTVPVSLIQKYLVKKLGLASETEVDIMCRGQPVLPSFQLHNLVDLWFRTASTSKKVPASMGSSAKDFVMVLSYCRKAKTPP